MENNSPAPLLSICIPTYNRDYLIKENLERLCPLLDKFPIEIVISDNCSTDQTVAILNQFKERYPIKFYVQSENVGPDKNFEFVLKHSTGKYRWLMGDGCYITEDVLKLLFPYLKNDYSFIIANDSHHFRMETGPERVYTDSQKLFSDIGWHMTWMSALIYSWKVIPNLNFKRYYNTYFIQTGVIFEYLADRNDKVLVMPELCVNNIPIMKHNTWHNKAFHIFCRCWYLFVMSLPTSYSYEAKMKCIRDHSKKSLFFGIPNLCALRLKNYFNRSIFNEYKFFIYEVIPVHQTIVWSIAYSPLWMLKSVRFVKRIKDKLLK